MPIFVPFRALRPISECVAKFSAKTTDFKNQEEVLADMRQNTETYYYVTKQNLLSLVKKPLEHFFSMGAQFIQKKMASRDLLQDSKPGFYVYKQVDHATGRTYTGIIGLADVLDLDKNVIKKHELTKVVREEYLYKQLHYTEVLGEPVLMGHKYSQNIETLLEEACLKTPEYHFESIDKKEHQLWLINSLVETEKVSKVFGELEAFYIADGHHRCASTLRHYNRNPLPANRFFMIFLLDETQFHIDSFHRLVNGLEPELLKGLKDKISTNFEVSSYTKGQLFKPVKHSQYGLLTRNESLILTLKKNLKQLIQKRIWM